MFTFNSATLTILGVTIKISSDIGQTMPGLWDRLTKLTGVALICIIITHAMPSLSMMDDATIFSNLIAVWILVITLLVNVWFQVTTGLVTKFAVWYMVFSMLTVHRIRPSQCFVLFLSLGCGLVGPCGNPYFLSPFAPMEK